MSQSAHGKIGIDYLEASAALGGDVSIKSAHQSGALSIDIQSEGLGLVPTLDAVNIANVSTDGLQDIAEKLSAYLRAANTIGQPVKYQLAPLPGMQPGNLEDARIISTLEDLKRNYYFQSLRLSNVEGLLNSDSRRMFLRQPQADDALRNQRDKLKTFIDAVVKAHDTCRKASHEPTCREISDRVGTAVPIVSVELPDEAPPLVGLVTFFIDGKPLPLGEGLSLMSDPAITLLQAARKGRPAAKTVDVILPVISPYLTSAEIALVYPPNPPFPEQVAGRVEASSQGLQLPPYFGDLPFSAPALLLAHADPGNPCTIRHGSLSEASYLDESCLAPAGRLIVELASLSWSIEGSWGSPAPFPLNEVLLLRSTTCSGQTSALPFGTTQIVDKKVGNARSVDTVVKLATGSLEAFKLADRHEQRSHDEWIAISAQKRAEFTNVQTLPTPAWASISTACEPRFP